MNFARHFSAFPALVVAAVSAVSVVSVVETVQADSPKVTSSATDAQPAVSTWNLDSAGSKISFVTVKASDIAEVHTLSDLSGGVRFAGGRSGEVNLRIDLSSVETNIPIRNERIREFLFEVARFPTASIHGHIAADDFLNLPVGDSTTSSLPFMLDLHGVQIPITAEVLALRVGKGRLLVTSTKPIIINAASVGLVAGIDKLQELASLPSISKAVPVSFVLNFVQ